MTEPASLPPPPEAPALLAQALYRYAQTGETLWTTYHDAPAGGRRYVFELRLSSFCQTID
jgi:hypothetical protein